MSEPSEQQNAIPAEHPDKNLEAGALSDQELDVVAGGDDKTKTTDESPKETVTFEYGGLIVRY